MEAPVNSRENEYDSKSEILKETRGFLKNRFSKDIKSAEIVDNLRSGWEERYDRHER